MRAFLIPLAVSLAGSAPAIAQEALSPEDQAIEQLLNQYATITLGLHIDQRCRQLYPKAADLFAENHAIIKSFMGVIITAEAFEQLNTGIQEAAEDEVANPCGPYTFDFIQASAQISSTMAYRINVLQGKAEPEPDTTVPGISPPPAAQEAAAESQKTEQEPVRETTSGPEPEVREPVEEAAPPPQPKPREVIAEPATGGPVPGETKKEMNSRQREEILTLRRKQREEMDNFKANQGDYPDPKAAKKALQNRQEVEMDTIRQRHFEEDRAARNK